MGKRRDWVFGSGENEVTADINGHWKGITFKGEPIIYGSIRIKDIRCGKDCKGCPHPGFAYVRFTDHVTGKARERYLGKIKQ